MVHTKISCDLVQMTLGQNLLSPTGNVINNLKSDLTLSSHSLGRNPNSFNGNNVCNYKMVSSKEAFSMRAKIQTSRALRLTTVQILLTHRCIDLFITPIPSGAAMSYKYWQKWHSKDSDKLSHVNLGSNF